MHLVSISPSFLKHLESSNQKKKRNERKECLSVNKSSSSQSLPGNLDFWVLWLKRLHFILEVLNSWQEANEIIAMSIVYMILAFLFTFLGPNHMNIFDDDEHAELNDLQYKAVVYYTAKVCRYQWYKLVWLFESV